MSISQSGLEQPDKQRMLWCYGIDIAKAFDKVWHSALIFKLHKFKQQKKRINEACTFILNRKLKDLRVSTAVSKLINSLCLILKLKNSFILNCFI